MTNQNIDTNKLVQQEDLEEGEVMGEIPNIPSTEALTENREVCNIRGHKGYILDADFYMLDPDMMITCNLKYKKLISL